MSSGLLLRALVFTLLVSWPTVWAYLQSDASSPTLFNDVDEAVYFRIAVDAGDSRQQEAVMYEYDEAHSVDDLVRSWRLDHTLPHLILGKLAKLADLWAADLATLLDLVVSPICYILFTIFFLSLTSSRLAAEMSTVLLLAYPWVLSINNYFQ